MNLKSNDQLAPTPTEFVDHKQIEWSKVRRSRYSMYQRFHYKYPGPISKLRQNLVVVPADAHGDQRLCDYLVSVSAPLEAVHDEYDKFGNRIFCLNVPQVQETIDFEIWANVERSLQQDSRPYLSREQAALYLSPSILTTPNARLREVAQELQSTGGTPHQLAERINQWVGQCIKYGSNVTNIRTTAAQALELGTGLCQDFAHIMLAVSRAAGLPARYVSGHLLGEGGSHAWVEVLLPDERGQHLVAWAYDPTNKCCAGYNYITVAVGRDFYDVSPVSGSYTAPYSGNLTASKRAGLTFVEYLDGETRMAS